MWILHCSVRGNVVVVSSRVSVSTDQSFFSYLQPRSASCIHSLSLSLSSHSITFIMSAPLKSVTREEVAQVCSLRRELSRHPPTVTDTSSTTRLVISGSLSTRSSTISQSSPTSTLVDQSSSRTRMSVSSCVVWMVGLAWKRDLETWIRGMRVHTSMAWTLKRYSDRDQL